MNPWDGDEARPPRQLGWGCLSAIIIGSVTSVVALILVVRVIADTFPW